MNSPGVALYCPVRREVRAAAAIETDPAWLRLEPGQRWRFVADEIVAWTTNAIGLAILTDIIFEKPHWYPRHKSKVDPNQLVGIAGVAANVTGAMRTVRHIRSPEPAEWTEQISKLCQTCDGKKGWGRGKKRSVCADCRGSDWETPRGRRIRSRLTTVELSRIPDQNDAIDAVGLALFWDNRLEKISIFSNGHDGR